MVEQVESEAQPCFTPAAHTASPVQGERVTWTKLSAIQANCGIEMQLDQCMVQLGQQINERRAQQQAEQQAAAAFPSKPVRDLRPCTMHKLARTPSWINMTAMGACSACSVS